MIDTEQHVSIGTRIDQVWDYVNAMERWANLMPGMREFSQIDADNSRWVIKVGVGGLVRTVVVLVHVDAWEGPESVRFSFVLQGDPVTGSGTYTAKRKGPDQTLVTFKLQVVGGGPMAPMWEAMGKPLLPTLAKGFAEKLKLAIEDFVTGQSGAMPAQTPLASKEAGVLAWLRRVLRAVTFQKSV